MFLERPFKIISFSSRHRVQFRFPFLPACICLTMAHLIENCRFSLFRFQTCLDNSVSCLYFSLRRDFQRFLYLVLKSLAVTPMYVCVLLSSVDVTSAYKLRSLSNIFRQLGSSRVVGSCRVFRRLSSCVFLE